MITSVSLVNGVGPRYMFLFFFAVYDVAWHTYAHSIWTYLPDFTCSHFVSFLSVEWTWLEDGDGQMCGPGHGLGIVCGSAAIVFILPGVLWTHASTTTACNRLPSLVTLCEVEDEEEDSEWLAFAWVITWDNRTHIRDGHCFLEILQTWGTLSDLPK